MNFRNNHIKIVLVEPQGPLNLGSIARVMKNFGLYQLILVNPQCDSLSKEARQMAVHAKDVLENAEHVDSLKDALKGCVRVAATTARDRASFSFETPATVIPWLIELNQPAALVFGPEDRGLSNEELGLAQKKMCIPTDSRYPTLNLAQSVALCCNEYFRRSSQEPPIKPDESLATINEMEAYLEHMSSILEDVGYLYPHTKKSRMKKFRQLLHRSTPTTNDLALLRGVWTQIDWALHKGSSLKNEDVQKNSYQNPEPFKRSQPNG